LDLIQKAVERMPIETYVDQLEPENQDAVIWRFMDTRKFHDLMLSGELYFCRADLFSDESEGLAPQEYVPILGLNPFDLNDRRKIVDSIGCLAQFREAFYISCWHLFRDETSKMWEDYGKDGVAIVSRYSALKAALNAMQDRAFLGAMRYGSCHLTGWNVFRFITTKRLMYAEEREVRAFLWIIDPHAGINRHIDENDRPHERPLTPPPDRVLKGHRRTVDLKSLITEVVVSPSAASEGVDRIQQFVRENGYDTPVRPSALAPFRALLPGTLFQTPKS
jgi:hypothetical protein